MAPQARVARASRLDTSKPVLGPNLPAHYKSSDHARRPGWPRHGFHPAGRDARSLRSTRAASLILSLADFAEWHTRLRRVRQNVCSSDGVGVAGERLLLGLFLVSSVVGQVGDWNFLRI